MKVESWVGYLVEKMVCEKVERKVVNLAEKTAEKKAE